MNPFKKLRTFITGGAFPPEYLNALPDISILGMRTVRIEPHRGLLAYSEERILVRAADRVLCVTGRGLSLSSITAREIVIRGSIQGVESGKA